MIRALAIFLLAFFAVVAVGLLATRPKPMLVEEHASGAWQFNNVGMRRPGEANPDLLFVPCPLSPQNYPPFRSERKA